jgi:hypothetical protein
MVVMWWMFSLWNMVAPHIEEENRVPLSVVIVEGTPNREIQLAMRASTHVEVSIFQRGIVFIHRVVLLMMVSTMPANSPDQIYTY